MKRPIDRLRESALSMEVGEPDSPITGFVKIDDRLHIVTIRAIYGIMLADEIDPGRTNPNVPNAQQKVLNHGSESEMVGKTLLTAKQLFDSGVLSQQFDKAAAMKLSFECLKELAAMFDLFTVLKSHEDRERTLLEEISINNRSIVLPSASNLEARCKEFVQRADHSLQALFGIAALFYGTKFKGWFEGLADEIERHHKSDKQYHGFMLETATFCKSVRITRNCIEHKKHNERVDISDFSLTPMNEVKPPMIAIYHPKFTQPTMAVTDYMAQMTEHIASVFEVMIAFMCSRNVPSLTSYPMQVVELPEGRRPSKYVRFSYGIHDGVHINPA